MTLFLLLITFISAICSLLTYTFKPDLFFVPLCMFVLSIAALLSFVIIPKIFNISNLNVRCIIFFILMTITAKTFSNYIFRKDVLEQPVYSDKATVVKKYVKTNGSGYGAVDHVIFFLSNGDSIDLVVRNPKKYKELKKNDVVDLEYQGWLVRSAEIIEEDNTASNE